jgi:hypothetical protein
MSRFCPDSARRGFVLSAGEKPRKQDRRKTPPEQGLRLTLKSTVALLIL